jgi:hypothetical protein
MFLWRGMDRKAAAEMLQRLGRANGGTAPRSAGDSGRKPATAPAKPAANPSSGG